VLGVFVVPDMDAAGARLVDLVRPEGRVVVTTWERGCVEPIVGADAVDGDAGERREGGRSRPARRLAGWPG
jgi:hypothetical protein